MSEQEPEGDVVRDVEPSTPDTEVIGADAEDQGKIEQPEQ